MSGRKYRYLCLIQHASWNIGECQKVDRCLWEALEGVLKLNYEREWGVYLMGGNEKNSTWKIFVGFLTGKMMRMGDEDLGEDHTNS